VLKVLLDVISAPLANPRLFIKPHVSHPWVVLQLLTRTLLAAPTALPGSAYSTTFATAAHRLDPSTHLSSTGGVVSLHNIPQSTL